MHVMSTNFAKTLVWKHENYVKLWRHKERTPNTSDHHMTLNELPPWRFSAYATAHSTSAAPSNDSTWLTNVRLKGRLTALFAAGCKMQATREFNIFYFMLLLSNAHHLIHTVPEIFFTENNRLRIKSFTIADSTRPQYAGEDRFRKLFSGSFLALLSSRNSFRAISKMPASNCPNNQSLAPML